MEVLNQRTAISCEGFRSEEATVGLKSSPSIEATDEDKPRNFENFGHKQISPLSKLARYRNHIMIPASTAVLRSTVDTVLCALGRKERNITQDRLTAMGTTELKN